MYSLITEHPVAYESLDHTHPFGTIRDNHSDSNFINKLKTYKCTSLLDIGCAGGGFVKELSDNGIDAIGIEGSDINYKTKRAEWATIPDRLFTADATKLFIVVDNNLKWPVPTQFDVVTAWELLEHIEKEDLPSLFSNIHSHLKPHGLFICSVATFPSPHDGVELHRTRENESFWIPLLEDYGFIRSTKLESYFAPDWVRHSTYNWVFVKE